MNDERQETVDDICQKIRDAGIPELADHILAAWKRERAEIEAQALSIGGIVESSRHTQKPQGNAAALREAVVALLDALDSLGCDEMTATLAALVPDMADSSARCLAAFRKAKAALAAPARQCDVGTAVEQYRRWIHFCEQRLHRCDNCPCNRPEGCTFTYENMPYEAEEGAGE